MMNEKPKLQNLSLDGGTWCFNFINTVTTRTENYEFYDYLNSYNDLLTWCQRAELIPGKRLRELEKLSSENSDSAEQILLEIKEARELLYRFFSAVAAGSSPVDRDLVGFNKLLSRTLSLMCYKTDQTKLELDWHTSEMGLKEPLWRVIKSGHDTLALEERERIKECERCGWIFLDQSRNKSRRWCSMEVCGSIHKSKKYYNKKKKESVDN